MYKCYSVCNKFLSLSSFSIKIIRQNGQQLTMLINLKLVSCALFHPLACSLLWDNLFDREMVCVWKQSDLGSFPCRTVTLWLPKPVWTLSSWSLSSTATGTPGPGSVGNFVIFKGQEMKSLSTCIDIITDS